MQREEVLVRFTFAVTRQPEYLTEDSATERRSFSVQNDFEKMYDEVAVRSFDERDMLTSFCYGVLSLHYGKLVISWALPIPLVQYTAHMLESVKELCPERPASLLLSYDDDFDIAFHLEGGDIVSLRRGEAFLRIGRLQLLNACARVCLDLRKHCVAAYPALADNAAFRQLLDREALEKICAETSSYNIA